MVKMKATSFQNFIFELTYRFGILKKYVLLCIKKNINEYVFFFFAIFYKKNKMKISVYIKMKKEIFMTSDIYGSIFPIHKILFI